MSSSAQFDVSKAFIEYVQQLPYHSKQLLCERLGVDTELIGKEDFFASLLVGYYQRFKLDSLPQEELLVQLPARFQAYVENLFPKLVPLHPSPSHRPPEQPRHKPRQDPAQTPNPQRYKPNRHSTQPHQ